MPCRCKTGCDTNRCSCHKAGRYCNEECKCINCRNKNAENSIVSGDSFYSEDRYAKAIEEYTKAIEIDSDCVEAYDKRGYCYYKQKEYDRAIVDFSKSLELDPTDAYVYNERGRCYRGKKEYDRAIADYTQAIEISPSKIFYNNRGVSYQYKGEYDRAIDDYERALELDSDYKLPYYNFSCLYSKISAEQSGAEKKESVIKSLDYMKIAIKKGYQNWKQMEKDKDLDPIRNDSRFVQVIAQAQGIQASSQDDLLPPPMSSPPL